MLITMGAIVLSGRRWKNEPVPIEENVALAIAEGRLTFSAYCAQGCRNRAKSFLVEFAG